MIINGFCWGLNLLPFGVRLTLIERLARIFFFLVPRYQRIVRTNLKIAFPERDPEWREQVLSASHSALARLVVDLARGPKIDREWVEQFVDSSEVPPVEELRSRYPGRGMLYATGHLGSFEIFSSVSGLLGYPCSVVFRDLRGKHLNRWISRRRETTGNTVISRKGAFSAIVRDLRKERSVAVLFDQNVREAHAIFVPWFSLDAATSGAVALAAIRTQAPIVVTALVYTGNERYKVLARPVDPAAIYADQTKSSAAKAEEITRLITERFTEMIREYPAQWFWMHRRWKTRPKGSAKVY